MNKIMIALFLLSTACAPKSEKLKSPLGEKIAQKTESNTPKETLKNPSQAPTIHTFDHQAFDKLLKKYSKYKLGRMDYQGLLSEKVELEKYSQSIAKADLSIFDRDETKALLINAYNANTLLLILESYGEIKSIKDLKKPWDQIRFTIDGEKVSLNNIEHNLLRPVFKDPRIHFAVNCASIGCPPLADFAFEGASLNTQLDKVMKDAFQNPRYVKVVGNTLLLTSLLSWYGDDFIDKEANPRANSLAEFVRKYASHNLLEFLEKNKNPKIKFMDYDWRLNDINLQ